MNLVIVESPTKAKTIEKYLGKDYKVLSSMGHIRELPPKNGSVDTDDFSMKYQLRKQSKIYIDKIINAAKNSDLIFLASDPDREGEAIAHALHEVIINKKAAKKDKIKRVAFNEINKKTVLAAIEQARDLDYNLINSQQARLALDYLVGFNLSPVLWRKLPGSKSAGRVQSVALRLIADREIDIQVFKPVEYWSISSVLLPAEEEVKVNLTHYEKKTVNNSFPSNEEEAEVIRKRILSEEHLWVDELKENEKKQKPLPPFTTSLLQQEGSRKLGFSSAITMKIAQQLYEGLKIGSSSQGLITYMRTDGMYIAKDSINAIRDFISNNYGDKYLPKSPHMYKTKVKNAQEAHEAIRVIQVDLKPDDIKQYLTNDQYRLYKLIWQRTVACQMSVAVKSTSSIILKTKSFDSKHSISLTRILFDGFLKIYQNEDKEKDLIELPNVKVGDAIAIKEVLKKQHFTAPPPRFNEASLIKTMEELSIGRPSTYSKIISILQEREYVRIEKKQFIVEMRGVMVSAFLKHFFANYVKYDFTAKLEEELDLISNGSMERIKFLKDFWVEFSALIEDVQSLDIRETTEGLNTEIHDFIFSEANGRSDICPKCSKQGLVIAVGKFGAYLKCPYCANNVNLYQNSAEQSNSNSESIFSFEENGSEYFVKKGPYGQYVEVILGDDKRRVSLPVKDQEITKEFVLKYAALPLTIGSHPEDGKLITANIGRYGPYINYNNQFYSVKKQDIFTLTLDDSIEIISSSPKKSSPQNFKHPKTKKIIKVGKSKYGIYILYNKKYHNLKDKEKIEDVTLEEAVKIIDNVK